ncbi:hypothetical protein LTR99_006882 [Exophiala xenobiotica]|uniref:Uncharacterized protein n=1 Tax=Vermiconidia calcicola TaxID=1690605 RepID=A0AAV9PZR6_9PEZI|nr:hypothetical protein LTR72_006853 [Exophiala xenobiotica]KAK5531878.1 hypothetical protein LTR25_008208 [Vermiconidia calcicola]KAK5537293.1 hypothetical protein LTR23_007504 [Chaetothyriales sp. CCFEE 6169]KAK5269448.1 hypothetical protein LTR96_005144 [Exophiala xenobiotica]KAK5286172.1 hypothetical protein LTR14_010426 [Exophiala xenobiotica]
MVERSAKTDMKEQLAAFGIGKERKKPPFSHLNFTAIINTEHSAGLAGLRPDFRPAMTDLVLRYWFSTPPSTPPMSGRSYQLDTEAARR